MALENLQPTEHVVDLHRIMQQGQLQNDHPLRPGDVIIVDRKLINF